MVPPQTGPHGISMAQTIVSDQIRKPRLRLRETSTLTLTHHPHLQLQVLQMVCHSLTPLPPRHTSHVHALATHPATATHNVLPQTAAATVSLTQPKFTASLQTMTLVHLEMTAARDPKERRDPSDFWTLTLTLIITLIPLDESDLWRDGPQNALALLHLDPRVQPRKKSSRLGSTRLCRATPLMTVLRTAAVLTGPVVYLIALSQVQEEQRVPNISVTNIMI
jgi:hypothetical protein